MSTIFKAIGVFFAFYVGGIFLTMMFIYTVPLSFALVTWDFSVMRPSEWGSFPRALAFCVALLGVVCSFGGACFATIGYLSDPASIPTPKPPRPR